MIIEAVVIKVLHVDATEATTSRFDFDKMYRTGQKKPFLGTLMRSLEEVDKGATITISPVFNFDDEYEAAWANISCASRLRIRELLCENKKIGAIKAVRKETGWGIKEAKRLIDSEWVWKKVGVLTELSF